MLATMTCSHILSLPSAPTPHGNKPPRPQHSLHQRPVFFSMKKEIKEEKMVD